MRGLGRDRGERKAGRRRELQVEKAKREIGTWSGKKGAGRRLVMSEWGVGRGRREEERIERVEGESRDKGLGRGKESNEKMRSGARSETRKRGEGKRRVSAHEANLGA